MGKDWYRSCPLAAAQEVTKRNGVRRATTTGTIPKQLTGQSPKDACPCPGTPASRRRRWEEGSHRSCRFEEAAEHRWVRVVGEGESREFPGVEPFDVIVFFGLQV